MKLPRWITGKIYLWSLCLFLLQEGALARMVMFGGGWVVSRGPVPIPQDDVKIEEHILCGKIRFVALVLYSCMSSNPTRR